ncbi:hypothetical protein [Enterovibrio norvegicus]|nr:hypothetical protein [Enterovibrio norvegicus]
MTNGDQAAPLAMTVPRQMRVADCYWCGVYRDGHRLAGWVK